MHAKRVSGIREATVIERARLVPREHQCNGKLDPGAGDGPVPMPPPECPAMSADESRGPLPTGYRQGVITAITVLLGFSLVFLRFWTFELPGDWNVSSALSAVLLAISILGQLVTLWRSLQLEDDNPPVYRKTLRWFLASGIVLVASLVLSALSHSQLLPF
jgi:hypothetical protein